MIIKNLKSYKFYILLIKTKRNNIFKKKTLRIIEFKENFEI